MSRNLLRKTKRENVQTLLYQTLNFARVVVDTDPYKGSRIVFYKFTMSHGRTMTAPTVAVYIRAEGVTVLCPLKPVKHFIDLKR